MPIFGSDGFRCKFGTSFLTKEFIARVASSLANYYIAEGFSKPFVIARDTRQSGKIIEKIIIDKFNQKGINTVSAGILPTPGLSKIIENGDYSFGCMITASHNPHEDNGIKLLRSDGFKINIEAQGQIEYLINNYNQNTITKSNNLLLNKSLRASFKEYIDTILGIIKPNNPARKVLVDCANGANSLNLDSLKIMKNLIFVSNKPNGDNINLDCGALEPKKLLNHLATSKIDYGAAFDGDGDRAIFVSNEYGEIETEKIALLFFKMFSEEKQTSNKVVTTEISNFSMKHNLAKAGGELIETKVGDRYVIDAVIKHDALFGFEPSGHFYFPKVSNSMDGMATFLFFLKLLEIKPNLNNHLSKIPKYQRIQKNFDISMNIEIDEKKILEIILNLIDPCKEKIVIRKSMWDPVLRIYYDFIQDNNFEIIEHELEKLIENFDIKEI